MFDPVLGPLNSYERGGPAAVSPHNIRRSDLEIGAAILSTEELKKRQQIETDANRGFGQLQQDGSALS